MRIRARTRVDASIPQTSVADIAFLLLIFFLAATAFDLELGLPLTLPAAGAPRVQVKGSDLVRIESDATGRIRLDGQAVDLESLHLAVVERLQKSPEAVVSIELHPRASYGTMVGVLDQVKMARVGKISLHMVRK